MELYWKMVDKAEKTLYSTESAKSLPKWIRMIFLFTLPISLLGWIFWSLAVFFFVTLFAMLLAPIFITIDYIKTIWKGK